MKRSLQVSILWLFITAGFVMLPWSARAQVNDGYLPGPTAAKVELSVLQYSSAPHSEPVHEYLLKAVNITGLSLPVTIRTTNAVCPNKHSVDLQREVFLSGTADPGGAAQPILMTTMPANGNIEFTLKTIRPEGTALNSWNCTQVQAFDAKNKPVSNIVVIESYIPNPEDFR